MEYVTLILWLPNKYTAVCKLQCKYRCNYHLTFFFIPIHLDKKCRPFLWIITTRQSQHRWLLEISCDLTVDFKTRVSMTNATNYRNSVLSTPLLHRLPKCEGWHVIVIRFVCCATHYEPTCTSELFYFIFSRFRVNITYYNKNQSLLMDDYVVSPEWRILGQKAVYTAVKYPCCPEPYVDISFFIWLERQPAFYAIILILPCFLLSSLTLVLFWLPPESPAKMVLGEWNEMKNNALLFVHGGQ